jgi:hypothetical protein
MEILMPHISDEQYESNMHIQSSDRDSAILVCDEHHNDIAEFYHNEHATVSQSYETALTLARSLVALPDIVRELEILVDWLDANQSNFDGEFDMAEVLIPARAALSLRQRSEVE